MEYDFGFAIVILCTGVLKKGNSVTDEDVRLINSFFQRHFSSELNAVLPRMLKVSMGKNYPLMYVAFIIRKFTNYQTRVNVIRLLLQLSGADPDDGSLKLELTGTISAHMGISSQDWTTLLQLNKRIHSDAYSTLEITSNATFDEVKKAFRRMAMKHHPDKFHHLGKESQEEAHLMFKRIKKAYEEIKRMRGV